MTNFDILLSYENRTGLPFAFRNDSYIRHKPILLFQHIYTGDIGHISRISLLKINVDNCTNIDDKGLVFTPLKLNAHEYYISKDTFEHEYIHIHDYSLTSKKNQELVKPIKKEGKIVQVLDTDNKTILGTYFHPSSLASIPNYHDIKEPMKLHSYDEYEEILYQLGYTRILYEVLNT